MKSFWKSKTIWVNGLTLLAGLIAYASGSEVMTDYPAVIAALVAVQGAVNVALRFVTWEKIGITQ
jgi:hypothetical protein